MHMCVMTLTPKKKWAHITSLWICILLVFCCYCLFWFWVLGSCNWGWPWTLCKRKDDLEFPILLLLPPEWILRLRVSSQPARCDFFFIVAICLFYWNWWHKVELPTPSKSQRFMKQDIRLFTGGLSLGRRPPFCPSLFFLLLREADLLQQSVKGWLKLSLEFV